MSSAFAALVAEKNKARPQGIWHSIWSYGDPGTKKTRFALGAARLGKVAYIGTESSAEDYTNDSEFPGFGPENMLEVRTPGEYRQAVAAVIGGGGYNTVIIDQMTDVYSWELAEVTKERNGQKFVPMASWQPMREKHKEQLRALRDAPLHKIFVSQQKEIRVNVQQPDGTMTSEIVGAKIDAEKKDGHVVKVVLNHRISKGKFIAEVMKDRLGRFKQAEIVNEPTVEMWLS